MFTAVLSTIIAAFSDVFWKKSLWYKVRPFAHSLTAYPIPILLCCYFLFTGFSFLSTPLLAVGTVALILFIDIIKEPVVQQVYKEEKISVLIPYFNLNKIFVIVASFFLFKDVSNISFCITILTAAIIILWAMDIKKRKLPRNFWKILFVETAKTIWVLLWGWLVLNYGEIIYFNIYVALGIFAFLALSIKTSQVKDLKTPPFAFWWYRMIGALGWVSWFLSLLVIKNLGLSISILLGFLWIWITLIISYIFLKDIPSRKNILLTIVVASLIWIWYYFK